ncbi:MAG TPA: helicase C-terminal domain-containing protein [Candidatus Nanoarchaeia archaeon]|nr:helicase C-terminal domain-containing protein [Candidatus Nanoarchaeia archaeon]
MIWSLYNKEKFLKPLVFSNNKTQEDIVKEVLEAIKDGHKIIFIHGMCGTGKSAIALNIAKELGRTSVVVPIKNLQEQYKRDYEGDKYLLKKDGAKLRINVITGRKNHKCKFLEENQNIFVNIKKEINAKLNDIFEGKEKEENTEKDLSADNNNIPCKIEIKEKNLDKIKHYLKQNKNINLKDFNSIKDVKRASVASVCPYWCPVIPSEYELSGKGFENSVKRKYKGLNNTEFIFYLRKNGCRFYEQFNYFIDSDVIVFNSLKYKLESVLNRKPSTEVEIIDECDEFLDSFSNNKNLNIDRLQTSLAYITNFDDYTIGFIKEISSILDQIKNNEKVRKAGESKEIIPIRETGIYDLIKIFLKNSEIFYDIDEDNYLIEMLEVAEIFDSCLEDSYVSFTKKDNNLIANIVTTDLEKRFKEMVNKNKRLVLMSGTIHSKEVLENIFGLKNFKIIEAETQKQGSINIIRTGLERDCRYSNFSNGKLARKDYLKSLSECVKRAKRPSLVHVSAFADLPSEQEIKEYNINNLISREKLMEIQNNDKNGKLIEEFKKGLTDILFSTRASRGIDFPGEQCNSIIFTKYPNPNVQDAFWKILAKTKPQHYWYFYKDKAKRELLQKIYRGLRSKEDKIQLLSPDSRVLEAFEEPM